MNVVSNIVSLGQPASSETLAPATLARLLGLAANGDGDACHALGVTYSTGMRDLIEAHKWFNLGALHGCEEAAWSRADIAAEMSRGEIAEAQRRAREWLRGEVQRAA